MRYNQNLHTHTTFCDGKNEAEDIVKSAVELGFDSIGFSGHAPMENGVDWTMSEDRVNEYIKEINKLKNKYSNVIDVYCGVENDLYSKLDLSPFEYVIGSVHFMDINGRIVEFDCSQNMVNRLIDQYFNGNGLEYAKKYYNDLAKLRETKLDIVGHVDIVTKHSEKANFFDVDSKEYKNCALESITALAEKCKVFEVNTGAVARGYRTTFYPAPFIMKRLKELDCKLVLSSDCHNKDYLNFMFDDGLKYIESFGFKCAYKFKNGEFIPFDE